MNIGAKHKKVISDADLSAAMNQIYNKWWLKWRPQSNGISDDAYTHAAAELIQIVMQYEDYPIVTHLMIAFLYELAARRRGEYTEAEAYKMLELLKKEAND